MMLKFSAVDGMSNKFCNRQNSVIDKLDN